MARTIPAPLDAHLQSNRVTFIAVAWQIKRLDGVTFRFTSSTRDQSLDFEDGSGAQTFSAKEGFQRTNFASDSEMNVDNMEVMAFFDDDSITEADLRRGLFDFAEVRIAFFNQLAPDDGIIKMLRGQLAEVLVSPKGFFQVELRNLIQLFSKELGEHYSRDCRDDLGGLRCRVPIRQGLNQASTLQRGAAVNEGEVYRVNLTGSASDPLLPSDFNDLVFEVTTAGVTDVVEPTFDETVGATTTDGTAVLTARHAWVRSAVVSAVDSAEPRRIFTVTQLTPNTGHAISSNAFPDSVGFPTGWFDYGTIKFGSGDNVGVSKEVRVYTADDGITIEQTIELFEAMPFDIQVGDEIQATPGCDKTLATCAAKFNNNLNFVGEPFVPGQDSLGQYPDARTS